MRLDPAEAQVRFAASPVLRLATAGNDARPHLVPCTFAVDSDGRVAIGIDNKPKSSPADLRRLRNISDNPLVSLLVDHYADDWTQLWWVRADGVASVEWSGQEYASHWDQLRAKYPQYEAQVLNGPVIAVTINSWSGWAFALGSSGQFARPASRRSGSSGTRKTLSALMPLLRSQATTSEKLSWSVSTWLRCTATHRFR